MVASQRLRVGVVGAGTMGMSHLRIYDSMKGVELVGVMDADSAQAAQAAAAYDCAVISSGEEMASTADAVSVAVTSVNHAAVGVPLLQAGVACLVEKPLAPDEQSCRDLIEAAERGGATLLVGHVERFNPAFQELKKVVADEEIHAIDVRRMNSVQRVTDVDVVADLMVHDLDLVMDVMGSAPIKLSAHGVHNSKSGGADYVTALLEFPTGALASLTASRITQHKVRRLELTTSERFVTLDFPSQELVIHRQGHISTWAGRPFASGDYVLDLHTERVFVRNAEPLALELAHFVECARGDAVPMVTGEGALRALRAVWDIQVAVRGSTGGPTG